VSAAFVAYAAGAMAEPTVPDALVAAAAQVTGGARAFTAAARRVDLTTRDGRKLIRKPDQWQADGWAYFDAVPEVKFAGRFMGNACSRIRLYPGMVVDPDEPPVPLRDVLDGEAAEALDTRPDAPPVNPTGLTEQLVEAAERELSRIDNTDDGMAGLMREFGINLSVTGDSYLVGRDDPDYDGDPLDPNRPERWDVYSSSALSTKGERTLLKETPGDRGVELPADALVYRIWRRHPQWPGLPDSNLRSVLDECEELLIYARQFRAVGKSRTSAGLLLLPTEVDFATRPRAGDPAAATAGSPQAASPIDGLTEFELQLIEALVTPIESDGAATAVVPFILRAKADALKEVRHVDLSRKIDDKAIERIDHLIRRLAHGLDLPVEVLTGLADANHWTGWLIEDSTYKAHVEPLAMIPAAGIASAFLRPALIEAGFDPALVRRIVVGLDPSALVARPNRGQDARDAHEANVLSDAALRRYLGFTDTDAPSDDELIRRYVLDRGIGGVELTAALMRTSGLVPDLPDVTPETPEGDTPGDEQAPTDDGGGDATEGGEPTPDTAPARALTAAGTPVVGFGERLAAIEARLRDRLTVAASDAVSDALRRAGNRLRNAAGSDPAAREAVQGVEPEAVGLVLGLSTAESIADVDSLLDGAFDSLRDRWNAWVADAQREIARLLDTQAAAAPDAQLAGRAVNDYEAAAEADREAGWLAFAAALLLVAREQMFDAAALARTTGEFDPTVRVQAGVVRDALARAGGLDRPLAPVGAAQNVGPAGLTSGARVRQTMSQLGLLTTAYEWHVGMPSMPFEPHQRLAGLRFTAWDDVALSNAGPWPRSSFYYPGDHRGCQCDAVPIIVRAEQAQEVA
jgi:hypothetical protein